MTLKPGDEVEVIRTAEYSYKGYVQDIGAQGLTFQTDDGMNRNTHTFPFEDIKVKKVVKPEPPEGSIIAVEHSQRVFVRDRIGWSELRSGKIRSWEYVSDLLYTKIIRNGWE